MGDFDDWPDATITRARRSAFVASQLARMDVTGDPLAQTPDEAVLASRRQSDDEFWREHEDRPMTDRLRLGSRDKRIHPGDEPRWEVGDEFGRDD